MSKLLKRNSHNQWNQKLTERTAQNLYKAPEYGKKDMPGFMKGKINQVHI